MITQKSIVTVPITVTPRVFWHSCFTMYAVLLYSVAPLIYNVYPVRPRLSEDLRMCHFNVKGVHISEFVWISKLSDKYAI